MDPNDILEYIGNLRHFWTSQREQVDQEIHKIHNQDLPEYLPGAGVIFV